MDENEIKNLEELDNFYWWNWGKRHLVVLLLRKYFSQNKKPEILDVGCGTGKLLQELSKFGRVSGVDIAPYAVSLSQQKGIQNVYQEDIMNMHFAPLSFDIVTALDILEHIQDDKNALLEIFRVLRHNGILVITVPANRFLWGSFDITMAHKRRYSLPELNNKLTSANFKIKKISYFSFSVFLPTAILRIMQNSFLKPCVPKTPLVILPKLENKILLFIMKSENLLINKGFNFPFGVDIVCVATKD